MDTCREREMVRSYILCRGLYQLKRSGRRKKEKCYLPSNPERAADGQRIGLLVYVHFCSRPIVDCHILYSFLDANNWDILFLLLLLFGSMWFGCSSGKSASCHRILHHNSMKTDQSSRVSNEVFSLLSSLFFLIFILLRYTQLSALRRWIYSSNFKISHRCRVFFFSG
jgi:hypothetical protein